MKTDTRGVLIFTLAGLTVSALTAFVVPSMLDRLSETTKVIGGIALFVAIIWAIGTAGGTRR